MMSMLVNIFASHEFQSQGLCKEMSQGGETEADASWGQQEGGSRVVITELIENVHLYFGCYTYFGYFYYLLK